MTMIEAKDLKKTFGPIQAVKGVTFSVRKGEVLGFLGPNGAGKSTVMRMLTCFLTPTSGTATIGGHDILKDSLKVRAMIGYVPESNPLYSEMTTLSFLRFIGQMRGYKGKELSRRVEKMIDTCQLSSVRNQDLETLSKGFSRRVGLAQALIHDPEVLILDEPTDGLDPNQKHDVRELIRQMASKKCIVISTHILEEVEAVCSRAIIIDNGKLVVDKTPDELKQMSRYHGAVRLLLNAGDGAVDKTVFESIPAVKSVETAEAPNGAERFIIFPKKGRTISKDVLDRVREHNWTIEEVTIEDGRLDEVFRSITKKGGKS